MALTGATHHRLEHGGEPSRDIWRRMPHKAMDPVRHKFWAQQRSRRGLEERLVGRSQWVVDVWHRLLAQLPPRSRVRQLLLVRAVHLGLAAIAGEPWTSRCRERRQIHGCRSKALGALALGRAGETGIGWR